ncbi:TAXI family TRAP transporter solute-binding subunit [Kineococcus gynurae]|uniref:TAXI family TRAP transporter solute-binding subunit n=1 Tax=Kineococcus gynurae TaxID=452979 RepID=A0ABV5LUG4_9ACTN
MCLRAGTAAALLTVLGPVAGCGTRAEPLRLAAGEPGGFYAEFGRLLASALRSAGRPTEELSTGGSVDNVSRVRAGTAQVGLALADVAAAPEATGLLALGRVYQNYLQLVVRAGDRATRLADLTGRPVSVGNVGSGAALTAARLLDLTGVRVERVSLPLRDAVAALVGGQVDGVLFSGGVPTPALTEVGAGLRLLDLGEEAVALRERWGEVYRTVRVPVGAYGTEGRLSTVGVSNLLLARADLPDATAAQVVDVLLDDAGDLVPSTALGTQFLDQPSLVAVGSATLHPGAAAAYRRRHG